MKVAYQHHPKAVQKALFIQASDNATQEAPTDGSSWWVSFVQGDESAYAKLYKCYFNELYDYGIKLCQQPDLVKDSIHDLFIDLWRSRKRRSHVTALRPYLYKALRNLILKAKTRSSRFCTIDSSHPGVAVPSSEATLIHHQASQQQQQRLHTALEALTQRQREVVFLKFYGQFSYDEVASVMKISTKATYKLMGRAIALLRQRMVLLLLLVTLLA